jgi:alkylation response protein AidB-like acyl-CoA dehydrogenase
MESDLTERQEATRRLAREFANEVAPLNREMDAEGYSQRLLERMKGLGLLGIILPEEYGGGGGDAVSGALVLYELARGSASVALTLDAHWLGAEAILSRGSEAQKKKYLPLAASSELFAFALTEPGAGSDAAALSATAERSGDGYVLNGVKSWCTNGGLAGL